MELQINPFDTIMVEVIGIMKKLDLVEIKSNSHKGFIVKLLVNKFLVYDCDSKVSIWHGENELNFLDSFENVMVRFENSLKSNNSENLLN